jgi:hypothetical protein
MDVDGIMGAVVALVVLSVGVFAFFAVSQSIPTSTTLGENNAKTLKDISMNVSGSANSVFNILGVVLIIGAIMSVVGIVYGYVREDVGYSSEEEFTIEEPPRETSVSRKKIVESKPEHDDDSFKRWKERHPELYNKKE